VPACRYLGGYIAAAFFAVGAPAALCIGYLSDKMNRRNLLFAVVLLGMQLTCPMLPPSDNPMSF
jgi:MFS family permease